MIKGFSISSWIRLLALFLTIKMALITCLFFDISPLGSDSPVQASQEIKKSTSPQAPLSEFKEGCCHPEFLAYLRVEMAEIDKRKQELGKKCFPKGIDIPC